MRAVNRAWVGNNETVATLRDAHFVRSSGWGFPPSGVDRSRRACSHRVCTYLAG